MAQRPTRYHALPANEREQLLADTPWSVGRTDSMADPVEELVPEPEPESPEPRGPEWPALLTPSMTSVSSPDPARRGSVAMEKTGISATQRYVPNSAYVHSVYAYSPRWEERRRHPTMYAKQCKEQEKAKAKAARAAKEAVDTARKHTGPLAERITDSQKLRYGEIFFEETGNVVPYIIAPEGVKEDGARKKAAVKLLAAMVKNMTARNNKRLSKPNITLQLQGHGTHYLEWAKEVYENDALSEAWGWCPNEDTAATKIQACARGRKSRRAFRFLVNTCERALMALVIEGTPRAGERNAKGTDDLVDAAEGVTRKSIRPIDARVSSIEWRFEGGWSKGSVKQALTVLSKTDAQQQPVELRWYVNGKPDGASESVKLAVSDAVIVLRHFGKTITSLKEVAIDELQLDSKLVAYYASATPAIFRAAQEERMHILQSLIETLHREPWDTASRGQQILSTAQQDRAKRLKKFPKTSDNGAGMTLEAFSQTLSNESVHNFLNGRAPNKRVPHAHNTYQGKVTFKRERTETLRTRAERLGCDLDFLDEEAPGRRHEKHLRLITKLRVLIDNNSDGTHTGSAYSEEISHFYKSLDDHLIKHQQGCLAKERPSTLASDFDRLLRWWEVMDSAAKRATQELYDVAHQLTVYTDRYTDSYCTQIDLIDAIVAQSQEAIERRKLRREARLKDDNNADIDFRVAKPKSNATQLKYGHLKEQLESVQAYFKRQIKEPDASDLHDDARDAIQKATLILKELLMIQGNEDLTGTVMRVIQPDSEHAPRELKRSISTAFSAGQKKCDAERSLSPAADETANGTPRLCDLVLKSSWEKDFQDRLREHPTLGAKLGMPLDLDQSTVSRMVFDIQRNIHLDPDEFPCPILAIEEKIKKLGSSHSQYEQLCAMSKEAEENLDSYGIGPTSPHLSTEIREQFWGDTCIVKDRQKWDQFRKTWGVTTVWEYLDWLRDHTIDLQKVRTYFLCDRSKGACRTVEDELRKELEKLPFVPFDADSGNPQKQEGSTRSIPLDRAMIEYGERMISMVSNILSAVINSDGWLLFPADRGPVSQLIGETIERLDGPKHELQDLVWVQCLLRRIHVDNIYIDICIQTPHTNIA